MASTEPISMLVVLHMLGEGCVQEQRSTTAPCMPSTSLPQEQIVTMTEPA